MRLSPFVLVLVLSVGCGDKSSGSASSEPTTSSKPTATAPKSSPPPAASSAPAAPAGPLSDEWKETDIEGVITAKLPGTPKKSSTEIPNPAGGKIETVILFAIPTTGIPTVSVSVAKFPAGQKINAKGAFDGGRDNAVKATAAKVVDEKDVKLGNNEGREFTLSNNSGGVALLTRTRIYVIGQNLVTIAFGAPEAQMKKEQADAFFDSIKAK